MVSSAVAAPPLPSAATCTAVRGPEVRVARHRPPHQHPQPASPPGPPKAAPLGVHISSFTRCLGTWLCAPCRREPAGRHRGRPGARPPSAPRAPGTPTGHRYPARGGSRLPQPPGRARSPSARAPASPRGHHHIVDDQVRRGQRPWAFLLSRAASFAGPGPTAASPIPLGRRSGRRRRHVHSQQPALGARAPQAGLGEARGRREGRGRGGAGAAGRSRGQRPRRPPS